MEGKKARVRKKRIMTAGQSIRIFIDTVKAPIQRFFRRHKNLFNIARFAAPKT